MDLEPSPKLTKKKVEKTESEKKPKSSEKNSEEIKEDKNMAGEKETEKATTEEEREEKEALKAAGAELLGDGRHGLRINGWEIESNNRSILNSLEYQEWEEKLKTSHLPEMVFGKSSLVLLHIKSGIKIHFNTFDALAGWKKDGLPPVQVPAAAQWEVRSKLFQQVILDYDYTFTTPYCGSETMESNTEHQIGAIPEEGSCDLHWEDSTEQIDVVALSSKEPILFYDEVVLYEDELADNGVSLLTVKVRVMPSCWFLLMRFWLRVDGVLMRLRDTRMYCSFKNNGNPTVLRESCWREATFQSLSGGNLVLINKSRKVIMLPVPEEFLGSEDLARIELVKAILIEEKYNPM